MELLITSQQKDYFSIILLIILIIVILIVIRAVTKSNKRRFTYHEATIWSAYSAYSSGSGLEKVASGKVVREGKDGEWQFRHKGTWRYLKNKQLIGVRESIASNKPITVYVD
jgi:bacteriorhodopsin